MLLRRLIENIKEQNWFVVWLDVSVVMVGIFLGMQVTNWNEDRKDDDLRRIYNERLIVDFNNERSGSEARVDYFNGTKEYGYQALNYLNQPISDRVPTTDIIVAFMMASGRWENSSKQNTYNELINSGRIHLLGNFKLRDIINQYYSDNTMRMVEFARMSTYFTTIRSIIHPDVQETILNNCEKIKGVLQVTIIIKRACDIEISPIIVLETIKKIENHPRLKSELIYLISQLRYNDVIYLEQISSATYSLELLKGDESNN
ncbi:hypothetical protein [Colwellia psychrerythraea]|uniref:Uncharacterized protein n=1 Tax=Colwellia psychrerythraea TaxID=28229 RepID=A0A099L0A9_COLPS|nr:hypothetical protein [Colwellia psychrerythraea]KGJ96414.1 hypothetical protein GAB14E_0361 [Colwellia psychrerythraea]